jgi:hypothetical protein
MYNKNLTQTLDWDINQMPVYTNNQQVQGYKSLVRNDTGDVLNVCKKSYTPASNEMFMDAVNQLQDFTGFEFQGYNEFRNGSTVLAFLKNTEGGEVAGLPMDSYMVVGDSRDYSNPFFIGTSMNIIRCTNAFSQIAKKMKAYHSKSLKQNIDKLVMYYAAYQEQQEMIAKKFEVWEGIKMSPKLRDMFVDKVIDIEDREEMSPRKQNILSDVNHAMDREMDDIGHNLYGAFQGITYHTTHQLRQKESTFLNVLGSADRRNQKAFEVANELATELMY